MRFGSSQELTALRTLAVLVSLASVSAGVGRAQVLAEFRESSATSPHGKVSEVEYDTGLIDLPPGFLAHSPTGSERIFAFPEPVWILRYATAIYDSSGQEPDENFLCHTFLGDRPFTQHQQDRMVAIYSDSFTRQVHLPEGFALYVPAGQSMHWLPLFNNRSTSGARVGMRMRVWLVRDADVVQVPTRLFARLHSTHMPHLFFVPPSRHQQEAVVQFGIRGRIHFMGTHVHPYAESVELRNLTRNEIVWRGRSKVESGRMMGFDVYSSPEGYPVRPEETFRVTSAYDNPTDREIDAMAGLFVMFSLDSE